MQVAIFSDVHGNLTAMQAVLADIQSQRSDHVIFAGDLCAFGARPADTLRLLRENRHILALYGNTDEMILDPPVVPDDAQGHQRDHLQFRRDTTFWVREQLDEEDLRWLDAMSFAYRLSPSPRAEDDLLVVHANPKDVHTFIVPPAEEQINKLGSAQFRQTAESLNALLEGVEAGILAYGHFHFPHVRRWDGLILANISAVGYPMDGDTRAKYGLLSWNAATGWRAEIRRIAYDVKHEQAVLAKMLPPKWDRISNMLDGELFLG
jgi:predicted phosphodiesterase